MKRSLLYLCRYALRNTAVTALILLLFVPYAWMLAGPGVDFMYPFMISLMLVSISLAHHISFGSLASIAFCFGATRKGWFWASLCSILLFSLVNTSLVLFLFLPVGLRMSGVAASPEVSLFPLVLAVCLLLSCLGAFFGYLAMRHGGKVVLAFIGAMLLLVILCLVLLFRLFTPEQLLASLASPFLFWVPLLLCIPPAWGCWHLVRRMEARG